MSNACNKKESKMAINVDNLSYAQAREYYMSYLSGNDDTGIGERVKNSTKWNGCIGDWNHEYESDNTDYDIDNKNLKSGAAGTSLGLGAGSAATSLVGGFLGSGSTNGSAFGGVLNAKSSGGKSLFGKTAENAEGKDNMGSGPGSTVHAIMMAVSAGLGMASMFITRAAQKKSIDDQNKVIKATQKEFEYDFNAKMMQADEQKEYAAMQYENALAVIEENEGKAALSDAVSGALTNSNQGLSEVAANQSAEYRSETGQELTSIADDIYSHGGTIPNNVNEFSKKIDISDKMLPYANQAVSVDKQNKIAMYLSAGAGVLTTLQCVMGMAVSNIQWWNYLIYGAAMAMAITTTVMSYLEAKKATEAQTKAEQFAVNSEALGVQARAATDEAKSKQSEYDFFAQDVSALSQSYGGTGGEVQTTSGLA